MATRQRARTASVDSDGALLRQWYTVETDEGVAVAGADGVFDFAGSEAAVNLVERVAVETARPLTVVRYTRAELGTYQAVTRVEEVKPES